MKKTAIKTFFIISMMFVMVVGLLFASLDDVSADTGGVGDTFEETFSDSVLANLIADQCGKVVTDTIEESDISSLTTINYRSQEISNLTGMNYLTSLRMLNLYGNQINDLSPLANLTSLEYLYLDNNQINDISPLANLTNLTRLYLQANQISDIIPLANLTNLTELRIYSNQITDLSPLANLTNLDNLRISRNQINDISPLVNLTNLDYLDLSDNQISDLSPLANLTNLNYLLLERQTITSEAVPYENPLVINNFITDIDGTLISPATISNSGVYDSGEIIWSDLSESITSTSYTFQQTVTIGNISVTFSGVVYQPITPTEEELTTTVYLEGTKYLTNKDLEDNMFTFVIEDEDGNNIATATNDIDGNIDFGELLYTEAGEYVYTIKEVNDEQENIMYDTTEYTVTVIVTKEGNILVADVTLSGDSIVFNNTYIQTEIVVPEEPIIKEPEVIVTPDTTNTGNNNTATTLASNVQTGDYSNPVLFILSVGISICIFIINRRKVYK